MSKIKTISRVLFAIFFVAAGIGHLADPDLYLSIMPPYLPWHYALVIISGIAEIALGVGLLVPRLRRASAWGLIALLIAVFPANIQMATHSDVYPAFARAVLWLRLPAQAFLILWAYWYTR